MFWLLACSAPEVPDPAVYTPEAFRGLTWVPSTPTTLPMVFVYDADLGSPDREDHLFVLEAHLEPDGSWVGTSVSVGELQPWWLSNYWALTPCEGSVRISAAEIAVDTRGPAGCAAWAGRWTREVPVAVPPGPAVASECASYRDCVCGLAAAPPPELPGNPFSQGCTEAEQLLRSAADDPAACRSGRAMFGNLVREAGGRVPTACEP